MPTVRPNLAAAARMPSARALWSSAVPCEKFIRTTSMPACTMRSRTSGVDEAGPSVATILVWRDMSSPSLLIFGFLGIFSGRPWESSYGQPVAELFRSAFFQHLDRRQNLAFEEFEEGAAAGRDVADVVRDVEFGDGGQRVAAAGN